MSDEFRNLRDKLIRNKRLYEDPDFPASRYSIRKDGNVSSQIRWLRPKDIVSSPKFIVKGATRLDLHQGSLGDCWFIAGVACLAVTSKKHLDRAVPPDQSFDEDYAGMFRFYFWQFDSWTEVIIDDRLPTVNGRLHFASNKLQGEYNEFWVPLIEKAYAKLYGCYQNIDGGHINDALVDLTGGVSERLDLKNDRRDLEPYLYELMYRTTLMASMMGSSIETDQIAEESLENGLYAGHAYSITKVATVSVGRTKVRLLRLRNPWGKDEWTGAWGDRSREWRQVSDADKKKLGLMPKSDGEFWMSYEDWIEAFDDLNFCHLYPDAVTKEVAQDLVKRDWDAIKFHAEWVRGYSAGGCGNSPYEDLFWTNPQFSVTLSKSDDEDKDGKCTLVVSLMQKAEDMANDLYISFSLYKLKDWAPVKLDGENYDRKSLYLRKQPQTYTNIREVTGHYNLVPGTYVIIPSTFKPRREGGFFLRVYTEAAAEVAPIDEPISIITPSESQDSLLDLFMKHSGGELRMDATELQNFLGDMYKYDIQRGFGIEVCRSLLAMMDRDRSGLLDYEEAKKMTKEVDAWEAAFRKYDTNKSGDIDTYELSSLFKNIGFKLSSFIMTSIVRRYGGKRRRLLFEDFIHCCTRIVTMYAEFAKRTPNPTKEKMEISLEEWLAVTMLH